MTRATMEVHHVFYEVSQSRSLRPKNRFWRENRKNGHRGFGHGVGCTMTRATVEVHHVFYELPQSRILRPKTRFGEKRPKTATG